MNQLTTYLKDSYEELTQHVTWPTWTNLQQSTTVVLVATVIIALVIAAMDFISNKSLSFLY